MDLTIAICTYRRFDELRVCLQSIENQTLERSRFRVLIIDNSLQPKESSAFKESLNLDYEVEYIITAKNGIAYARNQAIKLCRTRYLGYVDDDVTIDPNWAEILLNTFARYNGKAGCVSGKILPNYETPPPSWLKDELLWPLAVLDWGDEEKYLPSTEWFVTASIGFDIRALRLSGGFSESLGRKGRLLLAHEDLQIVTNLRQMGYGLIYNPAFRAKHYIPESRMTQEWYCKDSFWQIVSRMVYASGQDFDLDGDLVGELIAAADLEVAKWKQQPEKQGVQRQLAEVAEEARHLMRAYGYDPDRHFPAPEYRTYYIVTPCFNAADTIQATFESIFRQAGNHFIRYHVQDGGSTDGTLEIIKEWCRRVKEDNLPFPIECRGIHMTWESAPDEGMYCAIREGVSLLPIEPDDVMTWLNADDLLAPDALSKISLVFESEAAQWTLSATAVIDSHGTLIDQSSPVYPTDVIKSGLCDGFHWKHIQQEGSFWRKALWDKVGGVDTGLKLAGDWNLWRNFAMYAEPIHINVPIGYFRVRSGQLSSDLNRYGAEIDATLPFALRTKAAKEIAEAFPLDIQYQEFDVKHEKHIKLRLEIADLPIEVFENYEDMSKIFIAKKVANQAKENKTKSNDIHPQLDNISKEEEYTLLNDSNLFFSRYYIQSNIDVAKRGIDPLLHYIETGSKQGRSPNPYFSEQYYHSRYPDISLQKHSGLTHYIHSGWKELRDPHPNFSTENYLNTHPKAKTSGLNPLLHFLLYGLQKETSSRPLKDKEQIEITQKGTNKKSREESHSVHTQGTTTDAHKWITGKTYSKLSHWKDLLLTAEHFLDEVPVPNEVDLKVYQDLFTATFIEKYVPKNSRILEIGGGASRILRYYSKDYECWNIDKLEGRGNGPLEIDASGVRLVRDYMGDFSKELPEDYFDFVFSISVLEHINSEDASMYQTILDDIRRVSKPSCQNLHLVDVVLKQEAKFIWACDLIKDWLPKTMNEEWGDLQGRIIADADLFTMSKPYYEKTWRHVTGKSYEKFGAPLSLNVYWT